MVMRQQEFLSFDNAKNELLQLCLNGKSGELCLLTEEKHVATFSLLKGSIVGMRYRISSGLDALQKIKMISRARSRFEKVAPEEVHVDRPLAISTWDILRELGVSLGQQETRAFAKKILVVEDSTTQRKFICRMLSNEGFNTVEAADGYQAIDIVGAEKVDLVLLDIVMPGINGYEVLSKIREKPGMHAIPVIMLTSRDKLMDKMKGKLSGSNEYLTKPFKSEQLMSKINKYLVTEKNSRELDSLAS